MRQLFGRIQNRLVSLWPPSLTAKSICFSEMLENRFPEDGAFSFIQIGANDGVSFDRLFHFVVKRDSRGIVVEPLKDLFLKLVENYKKYPGVVAVNKAIHASQKIAILHRVDPDKLPEMPDWASGIGSLLPDHHKKSNTPSNLIIGEEVECLTLMELIRENGVKHVDLLQVDVEGYDDQIIKMIDFSLVKPKFIKYEHANISLKQRKNTSKFLKKNGYKLFEEVSDTIAYLD